MEVEAVDEGTLGKILVPEGTNDVAVNTPIAMILGEGEDASVIAEGAKRKPPAAKAGKAEHPALDAKGAESISPPIDDDAAARTARSPAPPASAVSAPPQPAVLPESERARRHRDGHHDRARSVARRHGGRDAPRQGRLRDGRGGRRISGRLQGDPGPAAGIRRHARDRHADHRARLYRSRHRRGVCRASSRSSSS